MQIVKTKVELLMLLVERVCAVVDIVLCVWYRMQVKTIYTEPTSLIQLKYDQRYDGPRKLVKRVTSVKFVQCS